MNMPIPGERFAVMAAASWPGRACHWRIALVALLGAAWALGATVGRVHGAQPAAAPDPGAASPIEYFQRLLELDEAGRAAALAEKPARQRAVLERKLAEYEAMSPEERALRLQRLRIPMMLLPLMQLEREAQEARLPRVPEGDRPLVAARLAEWNRLSPDQQRQVLTNRGALQYFVRPSNAPALAPNLKIILPPPLLANLEQDLGRWETLRREEREAILNKFGQFLAPDGDGADATASNLALTAEDRQRMRVTLGLFAKLPESEREQCLRGLGRWSRLSAEERRLFSLNVQRWLSLTPVERELWRHLVLRLHRPASPPSPPDARTAPVRETVPARGSGGNRLMAGPAF